VTPDTAAASVVSVPGVVAEYFNFDKHVLGRTSLPDIPARIRAGEFVWIDLDLAIADLNVLQDVVPIEDDCRSHLQPLAGQAGDVQSEPLTSVRRSERLLHITLIGAVSREESIDWDRCDVVIGEGFLLTLHRGPSAVLAIVRRDYEHDFQKYAKTSSFLIYEIWNAQINQFIALEGELEHDVESVRVALHHEVNETTLDRLSHMSAKLMVLRKRVLPLRRVLEELVSRKTGAVSDHHHRALVPAQATPAALVPAPASQRNEAGRLHGIGSRIPSLVGRAWMGTPFIQARSASKGMCVASAREARVLDESHRLALALCRSLPMATRVCPAFPR
jgi:hypothetical protein